MPDILQSYAMNLREGWSDDELRAEYTKRGYNYDLLKKQHADLMSAKEEQKRKFTAAGAPTGDEVYESLPGFGKALAENLAHPMEEADIIDAARFQAGALGAVVDIPRVVASVPDTLMKIGEESFEAKTGVPVGELVDIVPSELLEVPYTPGLTETREALWDLESKGASETYMEEVRPAAHLAGEFG